MNENASLRFQLKATHNKYKRSEISLRKQIAVQQQEIVLLNSKLTKYKAKNNNVPLTKLDTVIMAIEDVVGIPFELIKANKQPGSRSKSKVPIRHISTVILLNHTNHSQDYIARKMGYSDHSTVHNCMERVGEYQTLPRIYQYENNLYNSIVDRINELSQSESNGMQRN